MDPTGDVTGATGSGTGTGGNVVIPFRYPSATLEPFTTDVYSVRSSLKIRDISGVVRRAVIELYWQPENEDGTPKPDSDKEKDYQLMYRKTFRGDGEIRIDNLPPDTVMYAKGLLYYTKDGKTEHLTFYEGFADRFRTLSLDHVDDVYLEFEPSKADMTYLPSQMQVYSFAVSGPNANVVDKISRIRFNLTATDGNKKGNTYTLQMGMADARKSHYYVEEEAERPVWISDTKQLYLPSDTGFAYTIDLLDPFGNVFTRVVNGYKENTVDQKTNKSLNCCEKLEDYYTPTGSTRTARVVPRISMAQKGFTDGRKSIDRVAYEFTFTDQDHAIAGHEGSYYIEVIQEDGEEKIPVSFSATEHGEKVTRLSVSEDNFNGEAKRYEIWGLTAGHIYRVNVYGDYDLNNNQPVCQNQLIGSQRFSTVSMGSYGRVSYDMYSSHVKTGIWPDGTTRETPSPYESATAQKVTMAINYVQTNADLVDLYLDHIDVDVTEPQTKKTILKTTLKRSVMESEELKITGGGTGGIVEFEVDPEILMAGAKSGLKGGYLPKVFVQAPDFTGEQTMWDVFTKPSNSAKLIFYWEEDSLDSITGYQFYTSTYALQGGELHEVSGRSLAYRRTQFTTLKKMPYVTCDDIILVSDYIKFYGIDFHDVDHAIVDDRAAAALVAIDSQDLWPCR